MTKVPEFNILYLLENLINQRDGGGMGKTVANLKGQLSKFSAISKGFKKPKQKLIKEML